MTEIEIFAQRLKQARVLKKNSMDALALQMGGLVSKQAISKYESAKMKPSSTTLLALAEALDVDVEYFLRPFAFDTSQFQVSFRKKSSTTAKEVNALNVQIRDQIERYLEIEELLEEKTGCNYRSNGAMIATPAQMREMACEVRHDWNLGDDAIGNVQDILESKGIKVICAEAPEGFDGVSGMGNKADRDAYNRWCYGLRRLEQAKCPTAILVYGSEIATQGLHTPVRFIPDYITTKLRKL